MSAEKLGVKLEFIGSGIDEVGVVREVSGRLAPIHQKWNGECEGRSQIFQAYGSGRIAWGSE